MNADQYLEKLKLPKKSPSLAYLNEIISAHQKIISFNNLAVFFNPGQILNLELGALFEKVILKGLGGYCFENNKVFFYLLKDLGFKVEARAARVIYDNPGDVPRTHRTMIVTLDGKRYLADVGFGKDVPREAILLGRETAQGNRVIVDDDLYRHQLLKKDTIINLYTFDDGHYQESDFNVGNYYTNTHPDSKFVKELIVTRTEGDFVEFINGKTYTKIDNGIREDFEIKDQAEFQTLLRRFNIEQTYDFSKILK